MNKKWVQRLTFATGMLGLAGPELVTALDDFKWAKLAVRIVCGLALAFVVQSRSQKADEAPKP
jgi:hypothetical protein